MGKYKFTHILKLLGAGVLTLTLCSCFYAEIERNQKNLAKIRKGMTKKQVKYTWGPPDRKASSSGGWSYWYWDDGSYVDFKHGKVKYWYDAEG